MGTQDVGSCLSFIPCIQAMYMIPQLWTFEEMFSCLYELRPSQAVIISCCHRWDLFPVGLPHTGTHAHTYAYIASLLPWAAVGSFSLGLQSPCTPCWAALSSAWFFLLSAEPGIPLGSPLPHLTYEEGLKCLSGLARPYSCCTEIPLVVVSLEYYPSLCGEILLLQCLLSPCSTHLQNDCIVFVTALILLLSKAGRHSSRHRCFHILVFGKCTTFYLVLKYLLTLFHDDIPCQWGQLILILVHQRGKKKKAL